jgi:hypothetical protein
VNIAAVNIGYFIPTTVFPTARFTPRRHSTLGLVSGNSMIITLFRKHGSIQFDYDKKISAPFELQAGGYIGVYDVGNGSEWRQLAAEERPYSHKLIAVRGSRRELRTRPRDHWLKSNRPAKNARDPA